MYGRGVIDLKYNQLIFSTANAKPSWHSKGRLGPNLLFNSVVSIDLKTGIYKMALSRDRVRFMELRLGSTSYPARFREH